jgi:glycosyltransferase involved in cell wall biosynthesis
MLEGLRRKLGMRLPGTGTVGKRPVELLPGVRERRLCVGAIVYNEAPYLLQWLAYHLDQGFQHFYIGDNDSSDGTTEILEGLEDLGLVTRIFVARYEHANPQVTAYQEILRRTSDGHHLVAFIDADEYLLPMQPEETAGQAIRRLMADPHVGALGLHWRIFGSSGRIEPGEGLLMERFVQCAPALRSVHQHIKSIVRPEFVNDVNPHRVTFHRRDVHYINAVGERVAYDDTPGYLRGVPPVDGALRINHYVVKSFREYRERKANRGRATKGASVSRDAGFFQAHDDNRDQCTRILRYRHQTATRLQALEGELHSLTNAGATVISQQVTATDGTLRGGVCTAAPLPQPSIRFVTYSASGAVETYVPATVETLNVHSAIAGTVATVHWYGFELPRPAGLTGSLIALRAHGVLEDGRPSMLPPGIPQEPAVKSGTARPPAEYLGGMDGAQGTRVTGWARAYAHDAPIELTVRVGTAPPVLLRADRFNAEALLKLRHVSGYCGFELDLASFGAKPAQTVEIRFPDGRLLGRVRAPRRSR